MIKELTWDSAFFKRKIGELIPVSQKPSQIKNILDKAKEDGFEYISCKLKSQDIPLIKLLESLGFYLTDIGVILGIETKYLAIPLFGRGGLGGILRRAKSVEVPTLEDIPALKKIGKSLFLASRFYSDPFFSKKEADGLYEAWIENSVKGQAADIVFFIPRVGFITCRRSANSGEIVLMGIKKGVRGKGFGTILVGEGMRWFREQEVKLITVRTQLKNLGALNFYIKLGFLPKEYDIILGKIL